MRLPDRESVVKIGASFFEDNGVVMFRFQADASSVVGPRKANNFDKDQYPQEWAEFQRGRLPQLDHDEDGFPGGSKPREDDGDVVNEPKRRGRPPKIRD